MNKQLLYLIFLIALLILGALAWKFTQPMPKAENESNEHEHSHQEENIVIMSPEQIKDLGIETKFAGPDDFSVTISTRGKIVVHPDRLAHILPKVSGVAKEVRKNIGDQVKEGEILAILESREMADIKANYLAAKEKLALTSSLLEREERLSERQISAKQDYLNAKSVNEEAKINLQLAKQRLYAFGIGEKKIESLTSDDNSNLRFYDVRSPMNGVVIARHITRGEFVENTTAIYEIADLSKIWVEIGIYPRDLIKVRKGQLVDILLSDGTSASAKIIYLSPIIQDETITAKAIAELENTNENWRPGSFVKVNIATEKVAVPIAIPKEAYQEIDGKKFIFIKVPDGFEKRQVTLGESNDTSVEILSGLNNGEEYASSKTFLLKADLGKKQAEHAH